MDYRRFGFSIEDMRIAMAFERVARTRWGWDEARIQDAMAWAAAQPPNLSHEQVLENFYDHAERKGWPVHEADLAVAFHGAVVEHGIETFAEPVSADAAAKRLAEIRALRQSDPDKYDQDFGLQFEEMTLLDTQVSKPTEPPAVRTSRAAERLAEIRAYAGSDPQGYDSDRAIQAEHLQLVAATTPAAPNLPPIGGRSVTDSEATP